MNVKDAHPDNYKHFKWIPQRKINAYPGNVCVRNTSAEMIDYQYQNGDFMVHFPMHSRAEWFPEHLLGWDKMVKGLDWVDLP